MLEVKKLSDFIKERNIEDGEELVFPFINGRSVPPSIDYADSYYANSEGEKPLIPMDMETHLRKKTWNKKENKYSDYKTFKAGK